MGSGVIGRVGRGARVQAAHGAYTVVELLVVMSIMVIGMGLFSYARMNHPGTNLKVVQAEVAALVNLARLQARVSTVNLNTSSVGASRLIVFANAGTDSEKALYLRQMQVVVLDPLSPASPRWKTVGSPLVFPQGIYVVPPTKIPRVWEGSWPAGKTRLSQFNSMSNTTTSKPSSGAAVAPTETQMTVDEKVGRYFYIEFNSFGNVNSGDTPDLIVLSEAMRDTASNSGDPMIFTNPQNVRGVRITQYGNPVLLNDVYDFPTTR